MNQAGMDFAKKYAGHFTGKVLEVGSYNVNGTVRDVLPVTIGIDMREGPGVDLVCKAENLCQTFEPESFDGVVSTDALEHMERWRWAMEAMWDVLKPGGVMLLSLASPTKGRHSYPDDYWRMPMPMFIKMFGANQVLGTFENRTNMGAVVRKSEPLFLDFEPIKVK
jgi:predicted SAM-dependent methyltransferase